MKTRPVQARVHAWFGLALAALSAATVVPKTSFAADRMVLGEEFTATW